ncbi:hypothetical protein [Rugamonas apoptosis]|uniref:Uncharacterized protein n=1 Tax=Rugamonas apoptosis TaxID=2758570 RepID=A0A7W2F7T7_9BURK|nr:hypothetical protein [Rugamonas apoptosis]MBA5686710.1 hypothetical protein [Rugamonas apoptosis]
MKKAKLDRVPVIEDTLGLNLATLLATSKKTGSGLLAVTWQGTTGLVMLEAERMTLMFGGVTACAEIATVRCLNGRLRPLLTCPRAHEGDFQTLYLRGGELACRHCHGLRYRSTLAANATDRARLARFKLLDRMGGQPGDAIPTRPSRAWRKRYRRMVGRLAGLTGMHYGQIRQQLARLADTA